MADITRISVALPSEVSEIINAAIAGGHYSTTSEIVREALRDWSDKQSLRTHKLDALRKELLQSMADAKAGKGTDAFQFLEQLNTKYSDMEKGQEE